MVCNWQELERNDWFYYSKKDSIKLLVGYLSYALEITYFKLIAINIIVTIPSANSTIAINYSHLNEIQIIYLSLILPQITQKQIKTKISWKLTS